MAEAAGPKQPSMKPVPLQTLEEIEAELSRIRKDYTKAVSQKQKQKQTQGSEASSVGRTPFVVNVRRGEKNAQMMRQVQQVTKTLQQDAKRAEEKKWKHSHHGIVIIVIVEKQEGDASSQKLVSMPTTRPSL